jgi:hypothetical protein
MQHIKKSKCNKNSYGLKTTKIAEGHVPTEGTPSLPHWSAFYL